MLSKVTAIGAAASLLAVSNAADTAAWKKRAIYQVLTDRFAKSSGANDGACGNLSDYCGGTFKGLEENLDYIAGMGFDAIWISPVVDNLDGGYHGYWARDWFKINDRFGSEDDLKSLVKACHDKDIYVMVDVVANHVAPVDMDFSQINPFNSADHYHNKCDINWSDQNSVEYCRLANLPDLAQENGWVRDQLKNWVKNLVNTYGFDGIRIDTIPEVPKDFWSEYGESAGVFQMGECFNGDPAYVGPYQQHLTALFNYPMYYTILDVWGNGQSMHGIPNRIDQESMHFQDMDALGLFVDNHDNPRFLNQHGDQTMFKGALTFALTGQGIPFYYYGSEQAYAGGKDPGNRESLWQDMNRNSDIYQMTAKINGARKAQQIWDHPFEERYVMDNFYCFQRGQFLVATTNSHNDQSYAVPNTAFSEGQQVCNIFYPTTDCQTVSQGTVNVYLKNGESKIYIPKTSSFFDGVDFESAEVPEIAQQVIDQLNADEATFEADKLSFQKDRESLEELEKTLNHDKNQLKKDVMSLKLNKNTLYQDEVALLKDRDAFLMNKESIAKDIQALKKDKTNLDLDLLAEKLIEEKEAAPVSVEIIQ